MLAVEQEGHLGTCGGGDSSPWALRTVVVTSAGRVSLDNTARTCRVMVTTLLTEPLRRVPCPVTCRVPSPPNPLHRNVSETQRLTKGTHAHKATQQEWRGWTRRLQRHSHPRRPRPRSVTQTQACGPHSRHKPLSGHVARGPRQA